MILIHGLRQSIKSLETCPNILIFEIKLQELIPRMMRDYPVQKNHHAMILLP